MSNQPTVVYDDLLPVSLHHDETDGLYRVLDRHNDELLTFEKSLEVEDMTRIVNAINCKPTGKWTVHQWKDGSGKLTSSYEIHEGEKLIVADLEKSECDESEYYRKCYLQCSKDFQQLRQELTAERKNLSEHEKAILTLTDNCKHWRTQLTANDDKWRKALSAAADLAKQTFDEKDKQLADYKQQAESMLATSKRVNDQLREQLAAEREGK